VPEDRRVFTDLTVMENLEVGRQGRHWPDGTDVPVWTRAPVCAVSNLGEMPQRLAARMSGGEQQMLTVARTLMVTWCGAAGSRPRGIAPVIVEQMVQMILTLKSKGWAFCCRTKHAFAALVADRAYVLEKKAGAFRGAAWPSWRRRRRADRLFRRLTPVLRRAARLLRARSCATISPCLPHLLHLFCRSSRQCPDGTFQTLLARPEAPVPGSCKPGWLSRPPAGRLTVLSAPAS
jgi:hypothetical protein